MVPPNWGWGCSTSAIGAPGFFCRWYRASIRPAEPGRMMSGMNSPKAILQAKKSVFVGFYPLKKHRYFICLQDDLPKYREYLTNLLRNSISRAIRRAFWLGALSTPGGGSKSKEKRLFTKGNLT